MKSFHRRELLNGVAAGAVAVGLTHTALPPDTTAFETQTRPVIDTNVSLFRWPFRRLSLDEPTELVRKLRSHAITKAWAASNEGLLQRDIAGVNARLADVCHNIAKDLLVPFGSVNPLLPDWEDDLKRCDEQNRMPGIRLHPNYHGYPLDDPRFEHLLRAATERRLIVQLAIAMEDVRTQHRLLQVADVELSPLPAIIRRIPNARVMILNHKLTGGAITQLAQLPGVTFDISRVNGTDGVERVIRAMPPGRIVFGTHAPLLIYEAAMIKVYESNLTEDENSTVLYQNAERLMSQVKT